MSVETLRIDVCEGQTVLVHKVINVHWGYQFREVCVMNGPNAGMTAETISPFSENGLWYSKEKDFIDTFKNDPEYGKEN